MPPVVQDPGFETPTFGVFWNTEFDCDQQGAAFNTINPHSGLRCVSLNSRLFLGLTTCAHIWQSVAGWEIGATYQLTVWKRTTGVINRNTSFYIGSTTQFVGDISGLQGTWAQHVFPLFQAFEDPMIIRFIQPSGASNQNFQRNLDDIEVRKFIDVEKGIPTGRNTRGILDPQSVDASFQAQGPKGILAPQGPSATLKPLWVKGKPIRPS